MSKPDRKIRLQLTEDPGHGWLAVPVRLLVELGIEKNISTYSYLDDRRNRAYLEEDCDMGVFLMAAKARGIEVEICERHVERTSIRQMHHYHPRFLPVANAV